MKESGRGFMATSVGGGLAVSTAKSQVNRRVPGLGSAFLKPVVCWYRTLLTIMGSLLIPGGLCDTDGGVGNTFHGRRRFPVSKFQPLSAEIIAPAAEILFPPVQLCIRA